MVDLFELQGKRLRWRSRHLRRHGAGDGLRRRGALASTSGFLELLEQRSVLIDELRDLFEQVIESMSDALFLMDGGGRISRVNRAACQMLGRQEPELVGVRFADVVPDGNIPATPAQVLAQASTSRTGSRASKPALLGQACGWRRTTRGCSSWTMPTLRRN